MGWPLLRAQGTPPPPWKAAPRLPYAFPVSDVGSAAMVPIV